MTGSWEGKSIRLEVISGKKIKVPSERIPAIIYISLNGDPRNQTPESYHLTNLQRGARPRSCKSPQISVKIRVSFELDRMLGNGENVVNGGTSYSITEVSLSISSSHPSLTLKVTIVHACNDQDSALLDFILDIARDTDALALDQCPVAHPDRAAALTNLAWARLKGCIRNDLEDVDTVTSPFREALALRPHCHPNHLLYLYHLTEALIWRYSKENFTAVYIHESAQLSCKLLSLCPEGTYLRSIKHPMKASAFDESYSSSVLWAIMAVPEPSTSLHRQLRHALASVAPDILNARTTCTTWPSHCKPASSTKGNSMTSTISLYKEVLRLLPVGHKCYGVALDNLGLVLLARLDQRDDADDIIRAICLQREALTLCLPGNPSRVTTFNNLPLALQTRYDKLDATEDLNEAIGLYRDSLHLRQYGDPEHHGNLCNLSSSLCSRFTQTEENEDIEEAIRLCQESLEASLHCTREAYFSRYRVQCKSADLLLAVENFRLASRHPTHGFPDRIAEAIIWARKAEVHLCPPSIPNVLGAPRRLRDDAINDYLSNCINTDALLIAS
ncbi:hypothetical protein BDR05DRAFT_1000118 [Suillus weaverae]|nr:hypothetical protein BDR05DRAFT_1000118 [Suillus weaverae]